MNISSLNLLLKGDVMLGRLVNDFLAGRPPEYPWGNTLKLFRSADFRLCNLECVISDNRDERCLTGEIIHRDEKNYLHF